MTGDVIFCKKCFCTKHFSRLNYNTAGTKFISLECLALGKSLIQRQAWDCLLVNHVEVVKEMENEKL